MKVGMTKGYESADFEGEADRSTIEATRHTN